MSKKIKKDKRQRIPLNKYTVGGRVAVMMSLISIALFVTAVIISTMKKGNAGGEVGILGFLTLIISIIGFIIGIVSYKEENRFLRYSWIGTLSNMIIWVVMLSIILIFV